MRLLILVATHNNGSEKQVLVTEDEWEDSGNANDFFAGCKDAHIAGELECTGDTGWLSGSYSRD